MTPITIVGAGLAGCETAYYLARHNVPVTLIEMKPHSKSPAHQLDTFAELVCSNSLRGDRLENAAGLLKAEMRRLGSLILSTADSHKVPAGGALAVDRVPFSEAITKTIASHPNINVQYAELTSLPTDGMTVIATGPLTTDTLAQVIKDTLGTAFLSFYDAAAPILSSDSIDGELSYIGDRYGRGDGDYINCPMDKEQYLAFRQALAEAKQAPVHGFEDTKVFEGCMPVEVLARRGVDTLRYGPLRPIGLRDPRTDKGAYAVAQLRRDNDAGTLLNLVGFQNHLTFEEQRRVFRMIPALHDAEFLRYGVMHRNTFINAPQLLTNEYCLTKDNRFYFAGQITGVEGYVESAASGLSVGMAILNRLQGKKAISFPDTTAMGALSRHVSQSIALDYQPMNINFGLFPPLADAPRQKQERYKALSERALQDLEDWMPSHLREGALDESHN